ncbi:MAG: hypothetical protein GC165_01180 [Armatimonadetes bacterium]|nr:hypothetical protein [Armatimonadota bacterium]
MTETHDREAYVRDEAFLADWRAVFHPNIKGLPDYGLGSLSPDVEDYCRRLCEANGMNYQHLKDRFGVETQVISSRDRNPINSHLLEKGVVPINRLDEFFVGYFRGALKMAVETRGRQYVSVPRKIDK